MVTGLEFIPKMDNKSAIKLTGFHVSEDEKFIAYIENEILSHPTMLLENVIKGRLIDAFLELFCNVQKHARTEFPIFACGQYYPNLNRLSFTLVDSGIGYLFQLKNSRIMRSKMLETQFSGL